MKYADKLLWSLFILYALIFFNDLFFNLQGIHLSPSFSMYKLIFLTFPVAIIIYHSFFTLGLYRALMLITLSASIGTAMEYFGLKYGVFFGGHYTYTSQPSLFNVPIVIIFFWAVFIYIGYTIVNSFFIWLGRRKPNIRNRKIWLLPILVFFDGIIVVMIDLFMDPIQVKLGNWKWLEGGSYFGVPPGNFVGWFIVVILSTGLFRLYEYFFPSRSPQYNKRILFIPVLGYGMVGIALAIHAMNFHMNVLMLLGSVMMFSVVILNFIVYIFHIKTLKIIE
ncbi:hypothetical protein A2957_01850 [Candidatus Roizmanbacteria bacterium RIFCSPLOWO2_01_FULL_38_11]|uniref:Carotenoid biosynthesis protein n=1 Tax=Candidatus Roizmanbacteria bacterium RIFCSPLOWO2_01_FULL_38_11 TaxID=1802060 RepID=A0A1F7IKF9_9BACT|nr:MAG: hypothetical protein A2957_01850 [Candidatus Roizmanbacteria bacterium RIFCSPLOWO2_01_FULL_38_11]